jgi:hypothetical protein
MDYKMNEDDIRKFLNPAFDEALRTDSPSFERVWANAETAYGYAQSRYRVFAGIAATVAVLAIAAGLWPAKQAEPGDDYLIADAIMNTTLWFAPSDSLLPEHQFDIYREIPFLDESTNALEGTLL